MESGKSEENILGISSQYIKGVGPVNHRKYGEQFLKIIKTWTE